MEQHAHRGREPVQPLRQKRLDRRRHPELVGISASLGGHRDHLLDEERIALCRADNPLARIGRQLDALRQAGEQEVGLRVAERFEREDRCVHSRRGPCGPELEQL